MIVPLVLAAGASSRMGRPKAGLAFGDTTALGRILRTCQEAGLDSPVVVAGAHPEAVRDAARPFPEARVVVNKGWADGRTTSIQRGLESIPPGAFVLLWPVDCPLPGAGVVRALLAARDRPGAAWVPSSGQRRGHPVLLGAEAVQRLRLLSPSEGARQVIRALHDEGQLVHVEAGPEVLANIDTPEDYERETHKEDTQIE